MIDYEVFVCDDFFRDVGRALSEFGKLSESSASYVKTSRRKLQTLREFKSNWLSDEIECLEGEVVFDSCGVDQFVDVEERSRDLALRCVDEIVASLSLPNVHMDNQGAVCLEWGSVYERYLMLRFSGDEGCSIFWQTSFEDDLECCTDVQLESGTCVKRLPYLM